MPDYADLGKIFNAESFTAESEEEEDGAEHMTDFFFGYTYYIANTVPNLLKVVNFSTFFFNKHIGRQVGLKRAEILDLYGKPDVYAYDVAIAVNSPANKVETVQCGIMDFCDYLEMLDFHNLSGFVYIIATIVPNLGYIKMLSGCGLTRAPEPDCPRVLSAVGVR